MSYPAHLDLRSAPPPQQQFLPVYAGVVYTILDKRASPLPRRAPADLTGSPCRPASEELYLRSILRLIAPAGSTDNTHYALFAEVNFPQYMQLQPARVMD